VFGSDRITLWSTGYKSTKSKRTKTRNIWRAEALIMDTSFEGVGIGPCWLSVGMSDGEEDDSGTAEGVEPSGEEIEGDWVTGGEVGGTYPGGVATGKEDPPSGGKVPSGVQSAKVQ
jgi:hypothetical protein